MSTVSIRAELTPNPSSMRFVLNKTILEGSVIDFSDASQAKAHSPLAAKLFALEGVKGVLFGPNFITVTSDAYEETTLCDQISTLILDYIHSDAPILEQMEDHSCSCVAGAASADETTRGIIRVIEEEIRPAVAMDGGDVVFDRYDKGIVYLYLRGACSGCPNAIYTLKMGIERRLREEFPEIMAVEAAL